MCFDIPKNGDHAETTRTSTILKTTTGFNCNGIVTKKKKKKNSEYLLRRLSGSLHTFINNCYWLCSNIKPTQLESCPSALARISNPTVSLQW